MKKCTLHNKHIIFIFIFSFIIISNFQPTPMAVLNNSTPQQGCDSFRAVDLANEDTTVPQCELPAALSSSSVEVYVALESQLSMDDQMNSQICINKVAETAAAGYSKCSEKDVDIEKGRSGAPAINEEAVGVLTVLQRSFQKQISFEMGGKYMQFLMNHSLILPKFSTRGEKVEAPRMRKYKRTASFNSRKVALMFSVLSSLGTIILIYLTLRVKQMGDSSIH